jgi:hypothetical protein
LLFFSYSQSNLNLKIQGAVIRSNPHGNATPFDLGWANLANETQLATKIVKKIRLSPLPSLRVAASAGPFEDKVKNLVSQTDPITLYPCPSALRRAKQTTEVEPKA